MRGSAAIQPIPALLLLKHYRELLWSVSASAGDELSTPEGGQRHTKRVCLAIALVAVDLTVLQRHSLINCSPYRVQEGRIPASWCVLPHLSHIKSSLWATAPQRCAAAVCV